MPISIRAAVAIVACLSLMACKQRDSVQPALADTSRVTAWPLPAQSGAASPDLRLAPDGRLLLGWLQHDGNNTHRLLFSAAARDGRWQHPPRVIASGRRMFANWADTPHLIATEDGALWAHWLQRVGTGAGNYDIVLARSTDAGRSWAAEVTVNNDGKEAEHGFATLWPEGRDRIGMAWLDGRHTVGHDHNHHGAGRMTLRTTVFDKHLSRHDERQLDASTCDCCQTASALVNGQPLLAWRDRSESEQRDIVSARRLDGVWQSEQPVHADGWQIAGCPVNGPSLASHAERVLIGWYTGAGDVPRVRVAMRHGDAENFESMHELDSGAAVLGRVAVALDAKQAWIAWLREDAGQQAVMLARYTPDLKREIERIEIAKLQARGRASGFPKLVSAGDTAWLVWTDVQVGAPQLRGARIQPTVQPD